MRFIISVFHGGYLERTYSFSQCYFVEENKKIGAKDNM